MLLNVTLFAFRLTLMPDIFIELMLGATPDQSALRLTLMPDIFSELMLGATQLPTS